MGHRTTSLALRTTFWTERRLHRLKRNDKRFAKGWADILFNRHNWRETVTGWSVWSLTAPFGTTYVMFYFFQSFPVMVPNQNKESNLLMSWIDIGDSALCNNVIKIQKLQQMFYYKWVSKKYFIVNLDRWEMVSLTEVCVALQIRFSSKCSN